MKILREIKRRRKIRQRRRDFQKLSWEYRFLLEMLGQDPRSLERKEQEEER